MKKFEKGKTYALHESATHLIFYRVAKLFTEVGGQVKAVLSDGWSTIELNVEYPENQEESADKTYWSEA